MQEFKSLLEAKKLVHPSVFRDIHREAVRIVSDFKRNEVELVRILQKVDAHKVHRHAGYNSLFQYAVKSLGLSESQACDYITVARKSVEVPALLEAMDQGEITISKARRISPVINEANQTEWLSCAKQSSKREIEKAVARVNPKAALPERSRYLTDHALELQLVVSEEVFDLLKKAQDLASQKSQGHCDLEATIKAVCETYIEKHDPVKKAERSIARLLKYGPGHIKAQSQGRDGVTLSPSKSMAKGALSSTSEVHTSQTSTRDEEANGELATQLSADSELVRDVRTFDADASGPGPKKSRRGSGAPRSNRYIPANVRHIVMRRHGYQCGYVHRDGSRCDERRWLDFHHILPVHQGGADTPENLVVLCRGHHQAVHMHSNE